MLVFHVPATPNFASAADMALRWPPDNFADSADLPGIFGIFGGIFREKSSISNMFRYVYMYFTSLFFGGQLMKHKATQSF